MLDKGDSLVINIRRRCSLIITSAALVNKLSEIPFATFDTVPILQGMMTPNADNRIEQQENKQMLKTAIASLPENQRIAFVLSKYHELSYKEIAEVMDVTISSVESLLFRAKQNLQKKLLHEQKKYH